MALMTTFAGLGAVFKKTVPDKVAADDACYLPSLFIRRIKSVTVRLLHTTCKPGKDRVFEILQENPHSASMQAQGLSADTLYLFAELLEKIFREIFLNRSISHKHLNMPNHTQLTKPQDKSILSRSIRE